MSTIRKSPRHQGIARELLFRQIKVLDADLPFLFLQVEIQVEAGQLVLGLGIVQRILDVRKSILVQGSLTEVTAPFQYLCPAFIDQSLGFVNL